MKEWKYYQPEFECDKLNFEMLQFSPWVGHRAFGYDLMAWREPETVVELGSYYGCSAFAFAQAIKDQRLAATLFCIDTWEGDSYTKTDYKEDIYQAFLKIRDEIFSENQVKMIRSLFDDAAKQFQENSVDILHIDGSHLYEDVKHDYETWKDKVKKDGIILFHDVGEDPIEGGKQMGSHIFWKELCEKEKLTFTFHHSCGLGILFLSEELYLKFTREADAFYYQRLNNLQDTVNKDYLRKFSFRIRDLEFYNQSLLEQQKILKSHLGKYEEQTLKYKEYINKLEEQQGNGRDLKEQLEKLEAGLQEKIKAIESYEDTIAGKNAYISQLEERDKEKMRMLAGYEEMVAGKDAYIVQLEARDKEKMGMLAGYEEMVAGKDAYISQLEERDKEKMRMLAGYEEMVAGKDAYIVQLEERDKEKMRMLAGYEEMVAGKDAYITELENRGKNK